MKVQRQLAAICPMILDPLLDIQHDEWVMAPDGKWSTAQIVGHLARGIDLVADSFEHRADRTGMSRRATSRQSLLRHLVLVGGKIPRGRKSPDIALPGHAPDPEEVSARMRMGVERLGNLIHTWPEPQQVSRFVQHPVFGDLNLPEWVRFHYVHARHHRPQIDARVRWLRARRNRSNDPA